MDRRSGGWSVWLSVSVLVTAISVQSSQAVTLDTRYGRLRGVRTALSPDSYVDTFYNIPFAKPPVGDLRFKKPEASGGWNGTRDARTPGPICPQIAYHGYSTAIPSYEGSEDCLYLNVYTPKLPSNTSTMSVMVWIHGGGNIVGNARDYNATYLAATGGVVVVTLNYRLGPLGFLSTQDRWSPGNYGLWDQIMALRWVQDVISAFNGNPNDVTVFGESAGSVDVDLLIMSSEARGLFHKAIGESGVAGTPGLVSLPTTLPHPREQAQQLGQRLGCDSGDSARLTACLRTKSARDVIKAFYNFSLGVLSFTPVFEPTFGQYGLFDGVPDVIMSNGLFNNVSVIRGYNKDEWAGGFLQPLDPEDDGLTAEELLNVTRAFVGGQVKNYYGGSLNVEEATKAVIDAYVSTLTPANKNITMEERRHAYVMMMTDFLFLVPTFREERQWASVHGMTEYLYRFAYRSPNRVNPQWQGTVHADELPYLFGVPFSNDSLWTENFVSSWTAQDRDMSSTLMKMWTNFAKYGDPTPNWNVVEGTSGWKPFKSNLPFLLNILNSDMELICTRDTALTRLWLYTIPSMAQTAAIG